MEMLKTQLAEVKQQKHQLQHQLEQQRSPSKASVTKVVTDDAAMDELRKQVALLKLEKEKVLERAATAERKLAETEEAADEERQELDGLRRKTMALEKQDLQRLQEMHALQQDH